MAENRLALEVDWEDEAVLELSAVLTYDGWSGHASAYGPLDSVDLLVQQLRAFVPRLEGHARLEAGRDDGIGYISIDFYSLGTLRHPACFVRLSSMELSNHVRPEEITRLSIELRTEPWALDIFLRQLEELAASHRGSAVLSLVTL